MLFFCHPKFCISIVFSFSWELKWPQEKLKTMLIMKNFGRKNKEHYSMLWYFLGWSLVNREAKHTLSFFLSFVSIFFFQVGWIYFFATDCFDSQAWAEGWQRQINPLVGVFVIGPRWNPLTYCCHFSSLQGLFINTLLHFSQGLTEFSSCSGFIIIQLSYTETMPRLYEENVSGKKGVTRLLKLPRASQLFLHFQKDLASRRFLRNKKLAWAHRQSILVWRTLNCFCMRSSMFDH